MLRISQLVLGGKMRVRVPAAVTAAAAVVSPKTQQAKKNIVPAKKVVVAPVAKVTIVPALSAVKSKKPSPVASKKSRTVSAVAKSKKNGKTQKKKVVVPIVKKAVPSIFDHNRSSILANLAINAKDKSIIGGVDPLVAPLVDMINSNPNYCTLSSCSGRIALFHRADSKKVKVHMKRGGGNGFLFVSHDPSTSAANLKERVKAVVSQAEQLPEHPLKANTVSTSIAEILQFKFEPTILHVLCRTMEDAHKLLAAASESGHRQSGIVISRSGKRVQPTKADKKKLEEMAKAGTAAEEQAIFHNDQWKISVQLSSKIGFDAPLYDSRGGGWMVGGFEKGDNKAAATKTITRLLTVSDALFSENLHRRDRLITLLRKL